MPRGTRKPRSRTSSSDQSSLSSTLTVDIATASVQQLSTLSAEVLRLHLAAQDLRSSGSKSVMASRLYDSFHPPTSGAPSPPSSTMVAVQQSTPLNISSALSQQPIATGASTTPTHCTHILLTLLHTPQLLPHQPLGGSKHHSQLIQLPN